MTLDEKLDYIGGTDSFYVRANPRLHLPALRMADGPLGVRNVGPSTAYAAGIALAASFDTDLAGRVGAMLGRDARARGVHFLLGPAVNIYRAPMCGRNFEYFGEDPFLASRIAVAYINGVQQQGVSATVKHFIANNSEFDRHHTNAEIDERTMHEIYLPAFEAAVKEAHVGAIMSAYNLVNGVHLTQHEQLNNQLVKKDWAFDGIIMSDWDATYDGVAAANAGLDLEMPSGKFMNRATLLPAIQQGKVAAGHHRRQGAPHPAQGDPVRLARPRSDRPRLAALPARGARARARVGARQPGAAEEPGRSAAARPRQGRSRSR